MMAGVSNISANKNGFPASGEMNAAKGPLTNQTRQMPFEHKRPQGQATPQNPYSNQMQPVTPPVAAQGSQFALEPTHLSPSVQSAMRSFTALPMHQQRFAAQQQPAPQQYAPFPASLPQNPYQLPPQTPAEQAGLPPPLPPEGGSMNKAFSGAPNINDRPTNTAEMQGQGAPVPVVPGEAQPQAKPAVQEGSPEWFAQKSKQATDAMEAMATPDGILHKAMVGAAKSAIQGMYDKYEAMLEESGGMVGAQGNPALRQYALDSANQLLQAEAAFADKQLGIYNTLQKAHLDIGNYEMSRLLQEATAIKDALKMAHDMGLGAGTIDYYNFLKEYLAKSGLDESSPTMKAFLDGIEEQSQFDDDAYAGKLAQIEKMSPTQAWSNTDEEGIILVVQGMTAAEKAKFKKSSTYQKIVKDFDDEEDAQLNAAMGLEA